MSGSIRELKRRLKSIATTEQMTKAMKTVAVSKYSKALALAEDYKAYADQCEHLLSLLGGPEPVTREDEPGDPGAEKGVCYVVITGNRGLCGMYNLELMRYLQSLIDGEDRKVSIVMCGKWGQENAGQLTGAEVIRNFTLHDMPDYGQARALADYMMQLYRSGAYDRVAFVIQRFQNVLVQVPETDPFPPKQEQTAGEIQRDYVFLPDRQALRQELTELCIAAYVYRLLLNCAKGVHGATLAAMRTAADNSGEMYEELSQRLNRLRQMSATTEVIELSGAAAAEQESGA